MVTPALFARYPTAEDLAAADPAEVEEIIKSTGFYRNKTKSIIGMAQALVDRFGGEVPGAMRDLVTVPGVGRKTANVVRSVALGLPGLPVDTHVGRLSRRLGLTTETDPVKVEIELNPMVPAAERGEFSLRLILHGRRVCLARSPRCERLRARRLLPVGNRPKPDQFPRAALRTSRKPQRTSPRRTGFVYGDRDQVPATWFLATPGSAAWCRTTRAPLRGAVVPFSASVPR